MVRGRPGECRDCVDPPVPGMSRCQYHREKRAAHKRGDRLPPRPPGMGGRKSPHGPLPARPVAEKPKPIPREVAVRSWTLGPPVHDLSRAACWGQDPDLWDQDVTRKHADRQRALDICAGCPVQVECLEEAREIGAKAMIWGGRIFGGAQDGRAQQTERSA